ncbi:MAG: hypothetical protein IJW82_00500 [Clostridia bacterium]|nr:hypothetical protein [Clostridia bacterium]
MWFFIIYTLIMAAIFCYFRTGKNHYLTLTFKTLASMGFVSLAIFSPFLNGNKFTLANAFLVLGTIWGLLGDIVLDMYYSKDNNGFLYMGFASFAIGHFSYIFSIFYMAKRLNFVINISSLIYGLVLALIISAIIILGCKILNLNFGDLTITTDIYTCILCFITIFSWIVTTLNPVFLTMAIGFTLFLISDGVLSFIYFGSKRHSNLFQVINHTLYYVAQLLICVTILRI